MSRTVGTAHTLAPRARKAGWLVLLIALLAFHCACNLYWLAHDTRPRMGDEAVHAMFAAEYRAALTADTSLPWRARYVLDVKTGAYPPLFHFASALFAWPLGETRLDYGLFNLFVFLLLLIAMYCIGNALKGPAFGVLLATFTGFTPFLFGLSRLFLTDLCACLVVVLCVWTLYRSEYFHKTRWVIVFALLNALGLWVRWIIPLYYAVPLAYCVGVGLYRSLFGSERGMKARVRLVLHGAIVVAAAAVIAAPWYAPRAEDWQHYIKYYRSLGTLEETPATLPTATDALTASARAALWTLPFVMGAGDPAQPKFDSENPPERYVLPMRHVPFDITSPEIWTTYLLVLINKGMFLPFFLIAVLGMGRALFRARENPFFVYALLWVLGSYLLLTLAWKVKSPAPRYAAELLPAMAFFAASAVWAVRPRVLRVTVIILVVFGLSVQFINLTFASLGRWGNIELPIAQGHHVITNSFDEGVAVIKDSIDGLGARIGPAFGGINWARRALDAMAAHELRASYVAWPRARIMLTGLLKDAIESEQRRYWPRKAPLSEDRSTKNRTNAFIGPYIPLSPERTVREFSETGRACYEITFSEPVTFGGCSLSVPDPISGIALSYWSADENRYVAFAPPIEPDATPKNFHFWGFEKVATDKLLLTSDKSAPGMANSLQLYTRYPQRRALVLTQNPKPDPSAAGPERLESESQLEMLDYVIMPHPPTRAQQALLKDFEEIDRFRANAYTYWDEREFVVLARRQPPLITLDTTALLRITVSADGPGGRWDVPWWRFPESSAPRAVELRDFYWSAPTPATVIADLGAPFDVQGLEVVPESSTQGVGEVRAEYWDIAAGVWRPCPGERFVGEPTQREEMPTWHWHSFLPLWDNEVRTNKVRVTILQGAQGANQAYVSHFYLYGRPVPE